MNVLPAQTRDEAEDLLNKVVKIVGNSDAGLRWGGGMMLSTFGGHAVPFGGLGWGGWLKALQDRLGERVSSYQCCNVLMMGLSVQIFFMPAFFIPPNEFLDLPYVNGTFAWNNAWSVPA
jgi:glucan endo-1,3-alpha-glucosidase